jgi:ferredoxin-NADP reductase
MGINREYSMYSAADAPYLEFLVRSVEEGLVSPQLQRCRPGDFLEIDGPYGDFCLSDSVNLGEAHLFVATGTGIAPFHSFFATYPNLSYSLLHGVRTEQERYHAEHYRLDTYHSCISRPTSGGSAYRLTDYLTTHPVSRDSMVYLCGNRRMITDVSELLFQGGMNGDRIFTEVFF